MIASWTPTSEGRPPMLRLDGVTAGYGRTMVLRELSLAVDAGDIVAVLGRNGVGKTTMLRAIMGAVPLQAGRITVDGEDLAGLPVHARARHGVAYVPQGRDIFGRLSVADNLRVAAYASGKDDAAARVERVLEELPALAPKRDDRGGSLSGGQQQILALGRALISEPRILLLDEPSEGIQPSIVQEIADTVRTLNAERGITVILVEQNLDFATRLASRAHLVDKGQVVRSLPAAEVLEDRDLQHEYMGV
jgi:urea ABC transporter ATP-binding protein UrtE